MTAARVHGFVSAGVEAVRDAFVENFSRRKELGGLAAYTVTGRR
jgi:hypothetical protein